MSDKENSNTEPESTLPCDVLIIPSEYFFTEVIEIPSALEPDELNDFAELSIEGLAPFPLEQLYWGFQIGPNQDQILLYAALRDRLKKVGYKDLESYTWAIPDFATLQGARFNQETKIILRSDSSPVTLLEHPAGEGLPLKIGEPQEADSAVELKLLTPTLNEKGMPVFEFECPGEKPVSGHWTPLQPDEKTLWRADIRPSDFKATERNVRRTSSLVTKVLGYAAIFSILLVFLEGTLFVGQSWLGTRQSKIESQTPAVLRIEDTQSLMNKLEQVAQNELRPIAILTAANHIRLAQGKTEIEYDEVVIEGQNRITIEGKANTVAEYNTYTESLSSSGEFALVKEQSLTRRGKTTFSVTLDYTHQGSAPLEPSRQEAKANATETRDPSKSEGTI